MRAFEFLRSQGLRVKVTIALALALVLLGLVVTPFLPASRPGSAARYVTVSRDADLYDLGVSLAERRLVRSGFAFAIASRVMGATDRIQPGIYALSPAMSPGQIVRWLMEGRGQVQRLTVPEGYSLAKIARMLETRGIGRFSVFDSLARRPDRFVDRHAWLKDLPAGASLEGLLFPDTYMFEGARLDEAVLIDRMLDRFESVIRAEYRRAGTPAMSFYRALTLASIIELEAVRPAERPRISGVFQNRLRLGMRLGSDPTVEYALGRHQGNRGLSLKDIRIDSPYNTYRNAGLPPGPVANPGLASFQAALRPLSTDDLYFVARGDGTHVFTRSYADHLAAQRSLRK